MDQKKYHLWCRSMRSDQYAESRIQWTLFYFVVHSLRILVNFFGFSSINESPLFRVFNTKKNREWVWSISTRQYCFLIDGNTEYNPKKQMKFIGTTAKMKWRHYKAMKLCCYSLHWYYTHMYIILNSFRFAVVLCEFNMFFFHLPSFSFSLIVILSIYIFLFVQV